MSNDISQLHPTLQQKLVDLIALCDKYNLKIRVTECVRTVSEQDALYAKGRTTSGSIVTNAKGSSYSSMHQWGVAFDFCRNDGKGAYNDNDGFFSKVGKLGQSIGLEWGGSWTTTIDKPHFQLPNWGSTTKKLKQLYSNPNNFMKTWITTVNTTTIEEEKGNDNYMFETPIIFAGCNNTSAIILWQTLLCGRGYDLGADGHAGAISGHFGDGTYLATVDYKRHCGLMSATDIDGTVTSEVWKSMIAL